MTTIHGSLKIHRETGSRGEILVLNDGQRF
jgi:hypothetical protein